MPSDKQLDHLISVLYETVLEPSRWQEAVGLCGRYAGGVDAQFMTIDKTSNMLIAGVQAGTAFSLEGGHDYLNYYVHIDPRQKSMQDAPLNQWICCHQAYDQSFFDHNEFCQDFLVRYGCRYVMGAWVDDTETQHSQLIALRAAGQKPFESADQLAAQRFTGHLQRALRLQAHTRSLQTRAELGASAIDALALAMLIVDASGTILHLNASAEGLLNGQTRGLISKAGRLSANHPNHKTKLTALITDATGSPASGGVMILREAKNEQVFVTPLPASSSFARDWQRPLALILVVHADKTLSPLELMSKLYNLSPAELRVAQALLAGNSPEEYAEMAGVTLNTIRSQLKSLFRKTDTHRQSELVAVLSRMPPLQG